MSECKLCPRECGIDRHNGTGFCGCDEKIKIAKAMLHFGEEPCISGTKGSGAIFFSGCSLRCVFCQNFPISHELKGNLVSENELEDIIFSLKEQGAHNINFVTATHYTDKIVNILGRIKERLDIPIVWNSSGYEKVASIKMLEGLVDIFLPDLKYFDREKSERYSSAPDYFEYAFPAIKEMLRQQPKAEYDENGIMKKGVIVRHLVLPNGYKDSLILLDKLNKLTDKPLVSIMRQYTPCYEAEGYSEINRKLTSFEYNKVTDRCAELGLEGFMQEKGCDNLDMTPDF